MKNLLQGFPRTVYVDRLSLGSQLTKQTEELCEIYEAQEQGDRVHDAIETLDLIQASVTRLHMLAEQHGVDLYEAYKEFRRKNDTRGIYGATTA